jgi:hypothetical protein
MLKNIIVNGFQENNVPEHEVMPVHHTKYSTRLHGCKENGFHRVTVSALIITLAWFRSTKFFCAYVAA